MSKIPYKTALVTGASSGIGASITRSLTQQGLTVYALARRSDKLSILAEETGATPICLDLCDTDQLYQTLSNLEVDILVSNAGMGVGFTSLSEASREEITQSVNTNLLSAMQLINVLVPGMIARRRGHIIQMGSIAGLYPLFSTIYGATKGRIHLMCQNLRLELKGTSVRCTEICPGRVNTEFFDKAFDSKDAQRMMTEITPLSPDDIAEAVWYALSAPPHVNVGLLEITPTEQAAGGLVSQASPPFNETS